MAAYAVALVLLGTAYVTLVFTGPRTALLFAIFALAMMLVAVMLVLRR
jgi:hypothetical protein